VACPIANPITSYPTALTWVTLKSYLEGNNTATRLRHDMVTEVRSCNVAFGDSPKSSFATQKGKLLNPPKCLGRVM